ncbi:MAG TPA: DUF5777 family beta-barrel protein [Aridibacter sp.]|nr:DUF5777 family beta-barrel protein [Aridibacter sp.]
MCDLRFIRLVCSITFAMGLLLCSTATALSQSEPASSAPQSGDAEFEQPVPQNNGLRVKFADDSPGVAFVEIDGKRYRIDTLKKTAEEVLSEQPESLTDGNDPEDASVADSDPEQIQEDEQEVDAYYFEPGFEPYDYRLINVQTTKSVPKGSWNLSFSHRFTKPIHPISDSGPELLGFDSFSVSSFGVSYGITDKLYLSASRNPICRRGLCRTIEVGAGYHWLDQGKASPVGLTTYASLEGNDNFTEQYTLNLQTMMSRSVGNRVHLFFSPAIHLFTNGGRRFDPRPDDFFPPASAAETFRLPKHSASFGFGTAINITPTLLGLFEFTPRTGFKLGRVIPVLDDKLNIVDFENLSEPSIGFGIQKNIGDHAFILTFSNTQTTTTSKYNSSNLVFPPQRLVIGFNLFRRL